MKRNMRKAHCKCCGNEIVKGKGSLYYKFAPNNDYLVGRIFMCPRCNRILEKLFGISMYCGVI